MPTEVKIEKISLDLLSDDSDAGDTRATRAAMVSAFPLGTLAVFDSGLSDGQPAGLSDRFFDDRRGDLLLQSTDHLFARVRLDVLRREIRSADDWLPEDLETLPEVMPEGMPMITMQEDAASLGLLLNHALTAEPSYRQLTFGQAQRCVICRCFHRTAFDCSDSSSRLVDLADRYDSPRALASGMQQLARHAPSHAPTVFVIAAAHGDVDGCREA